MSQSSIDLYTTRTKIADTNARFLGVDISELMEAAGSGIAKELIKKYGKSNSIAFICGLGNNGGDGLSAARQLALMGYKGQITVYLAGRSNRIKTSAASKHWDLLSSFVIKYPDQNIKVIQDCYSKDIDNHDLIVECLVGTGISGKLKKRFKGIVSRCSHFRKRMIAIDVPVPGYSWDLSVSLMYPKTQDAISVDVGMPDAAELYTGPGEVQALFEPKKSSYKSQNGKVLIMAGSEEYHGALLLSATAAGKYAGLVYIYTIPENRHLIKEMESELAEFIEVTDSTLSDTLDKVDSVMVGPGWEDNIPNRSTLNYVVENYPNKMFILDATAISMVKMELVQRSGNILFTPHRGELAKLMKIDKVGSALQGQLRRFCKENNCYINLKGSNSILVGYNPLTDTVDLRINRTGNQGMAKGGSGDMLAGLTAAITSKNNMWLSMTSAAFLAGISADIAYDQQGTKYSASDLVGLLPQAWQIVREF